MRSVRCGPGEVRLSSKGDIRQGPGHDIGHRLSRWLRLRFFLILVMLAGVSLGAFSIFYLLVNGQDEGAALLNASGNQRVLADRIATDALLLQDAPPAERPVIRLRLRQAARQLQQAETTMNYAVAGVRARHRAEAILQGDVYKLSRHLAELTALVDNLTAQPDAALTPGDPVVRSIERLTRGPLGAGLDQMVVVLGEGLRHRVTNLNLFALVGEPLFLVLLALMAWKVFGPLLRQTESAVSQLEALERYHRSVVDSLADGVLVVDPRQRRIEALNPSAQEIFHLPEPAAIGLPLEALVPVSDRLSIANLRHWTRQEVEGRTIDGQPFHLEMTIREAAVEGFDRLIVVARDVTKQVEAEEKIHTLSDALEQSAASVIITNIEGVIVYANPRTLEITGYSRDELVGQNPRLLQSGLTPAHVYSELWRDLKAGRDWRGEILNRRKSGELYWESLMISPLRSSRGEIIQYMAVMEDVTDRKMMEEALMVAKQQAERANRAKSDFLASMSHELRTPLNAIIGYSEFIDTEPFGALGHDKYREYLAHIHESGCHLLDLINDMLDLSKVEAGKLELEEEEVDLAASVQAAMHLVQERAQRSNVRLVVEVADHLPRLKADNLRLKQIMLNLLTNAIKFTPENGRVTLRAGLDEAGGVEISVADTGVGIAPEDIARVLEPFSQVVNPMVRREEGTGLGLPISKRLVELHGGSLTLSSEVGHGTRVTVRLPAERLVPAAAV
ncbi:cell-division control histidine kinase PdhS [mine drainage metagenome]|uniref:histidine kinase n=1 Tax=mine drainage metagenome TaxID=410659 RepID=A0A1J5QWG9_9ZZZZ